MYWFDDLITFFGVMGLLHDDKDLEWFLIDYRTHENVLGMVNKTMTTWNP